MDSTTYRPQSPDLSSFAAPVPQSPDFSGVRPQSPDLSGLASPPQFSGTPQQHYHHQQPGGGSRFGGAFAGNGFGGAALNYSPTSIPPPEHHPYQQHYQQLQQAPFAQLFPSQYQQHNMPPTTRGVKVDYSETDEYLPDAPTNKRPRKGPMPANGRGFDQSQQSQADPTLGVHLKTSFPVARIKRIMQADEDIGKVAQVTPHVVSRALELFMIRLISASAKQAQGGGVDGGSGKGPKRILAQHMKRAIMADNTFDFLHPIVEKVPDAPVKGKKEANSDEEDEKPKKGRGKKRKDSGDDF